MRGLTIHVIPYLALVLTSMLGKNFSRHFEIFFLCYPENWLCHFKPILSLGDTLHEMSKPFSWKNKKKYFKMSSAELVRSVVKTQILLL